MQYAPPGVEMTNQSLNRPVEEPGLLLPGKVAVLVPAEASIEKPPARLAKVAFCTNDAPIALTTLVLI